MKKTLQELEDERDKLTLDLQYRPQTDDSVMNRLKELKNMINSGRFS